MSQPLVFKIYFQNEVRRFQQPPDISFYDFLLTLEKAIFRDNLDYHRELYLQYEDNEENKRITITSHIDWYEALEFQSSQSLKKFYIVEGSGVYYKDSPSPEPLFFVLKFQKIAGIYKTKIQLDPKGMSFGPYPDLRISPDGVLHLGGEKIKDIVYCAETGVLSWKDAHNDSSAELKFNFEGVRPAFKGELKALHDDTVDLVGTWNEPTELEEFTADQLERIKNSVPNFLSKLFPGGKILPFHIPPWLQGAIRVSRLLDSKGNPTNDVDLDVNIPLLFEAIHEEAVAKIRSDLNKADEYLHYALKLMPRSPYAFYNLACVRALQSRPDDAFPFLRKSIENGYSNWKHLVTDEDLVSLHEDPRFDELLPEKIN